MDKRTFALFACLPATLFLLSCWEDPAGPAGARPDDTTFVHDTLRVHDTVGVHDTVPPPLGLCDFDSPSPSDTLTGDFAPLAVGNEWEYMDSTIHGSSSIGYGSTTRAGIVTIRVVQTRCETAHLIHTLRFHFEGKMRQLSGQGEVVTLDSSWDESLEKTLTCLDDGSRIDCAGSDNSLGIYLKLFRFHRARVADLVPGVDPTTGSPATKAYLDDPFWGSRPLRWKDIGMVEIKESSSGGGTGHGWSLFEYARLLSFNGTPTPYR